MKGTKVLAIDDDSEFLGIIAELLSEDFTVTCKTSGEAAIQLCNDLKPDIVLLDISMSPMDGYTACQRIKSIDENNNPAVVFVSGLTGKDDILKAYDTGADDYIIKPFHNNEFISKLQAIERFNIKRSELIDREKLSRTVAFQSMKEASEYGNIVQFLKDTFSCKSPAELAETLFKTTRQYDISCCVQIRTSEGNLNYADSGTQCSPIEVKIFKELLHAGRIVDFNSRTIFNDHHVSIFVKNMPIDDPERYGRLKDTLAVIIEGMETRIVDVLRRSYIVHTMETTKDSIRKMENQFLSHERQTLDAIEALMDNLNKALSNLALSEEQEIFLLSFVEQSMGHLVDINIEGRKIDNFIEEIIQGIKSCIKI